MFLLEGFDQFFLFVELNPAEAFVEACFFILISHTKNTQTQVQLFFTGCKNLLD